MHLFIEARWYCVTGVEFVQGNFIIAHRVRAGLLLGLFVGHWLSRLPFFVWNY